MLAGSDRVVAGAEPVDRSLPDRIPVGRVVEPAQQGDVTGIVDLAQLGVGRRARHDPLGRGDEVVPLEQVEQG